MITIIVNKDKVSGTKDSVQIWLTDDHTGLFPIADITKSLNVMTIHPHIHAGGVPTLNMQMHMPEMRIGTGPKATTTADVYQFPTSQTRH